jgi:hypothetical protein
VFIALLACRPLGAAQHADQLLDAINRTTAWVERNAVDPRDPLLQRFVFDAWARHLIATRHPDRSTRARFAPALDRDLRVVEPTAPLELVPLTYWALLLRIMSERGVDVARQVADLNARVQLPTVLAQADRTTAYWTSALLARSGVAIDAESYFERGWVAQSAGAVAATAYAPSLSDAYRVFHEIVPRANLGTKPPDLSPAQRAFLRRAVPELIAFCRRNSAVDAMAEVLVSSAMLGPSSQAEYRSSIEFVLAHQRHDGTFTDPSRPTTSIDEQRHTVLTGLWALLMAVEPS